MKCILLWCILWRLIDHLGCVCVFGGDPDFFLFFFSFRYSSSMVHRNEKKKTERKEQNQAQLFFLSFLRFYFAFEKKEKFSNRHKGHHHHHHFIQACFFFHLGWQLIFNIFSFYFFIHFRFNDATMEKTNKQKRIFPKVPSLPFACCCCWSRQKSKCQNETNKQQNRGKKQISIM